MAASKKKGGRPKYTCKEEIEGLIDQYFKSCEGHIAMNEFTGEPVLNKYGEPVYIDRRPPTVTGLALALGFTTRTSLLTYQGKAEFRDTILRAKSRVEQYTEERLFDRDSANGARFSLQFNFENWREEKPDAAPAPTVKIIEDIPKTADAAAEEAATQEGEGEAAEVEVTESANSANSAE